MNVTEYEKTAKKILELRHRRKRLQEEINELVSLIITWMKSDDKRILKAGSYSLEIASRIRRDFDFEALDRLQAQGYIKPEVMKKYTYERLLITSGSKMRLDGNKFVR
jgi:hypothetical protein